MADIALEKRVAELEHENAQLRQQIQSWGSELPADLTTRWLAAVADAKQQTRKDGRVNPYLGLTSVEAQVWWWENIEKPRLMNLPESQEPS